MPVPHPVEFPDHWEPISSHGVFPQCHATTVHVRAGDTVRAWNTRRQRKGIPPKPFKRRVRFPRLIGWDYWDVSWWTAFTFTVGSIAWVINGGFLFYLPPTPKNDIVSNSLALFGGTLFYIGGWCMYWEALNVDEKSVFGRVVKLEERRFFADITFISAPKGQGSGWKWLGLKSWKSISFVANFTQFLGTSVFWISTIATAPGVVTANDNIPADKLNAIYAGVVWTPQVIGASLLLFSSCLITLETQTHWYAINILDLGWHVGFWNVLGSAGFLVSACFGYSNAPSDTAYFHWGVAFSTYLGSWTFLLGSYLQYYEILNKAEAEERATGHKVLTTA